MSIQCRLGHHDPGAVRGTQPFYTCERCGKVDCYQKLSTHVLTQYLERQDKLERIISKDRYWMP